MTLAVLDSSALMALMLNEPGSDVVAASLDGAISAVNLAEVGAKMLVRGLSLGDRTCFALAGQTGRRALTTDREWAEVGLDLDICLIRPRRVERRSRPDHRPARALLTPAARSTSPRREGRLRARRHARR